MDDIRRLRERQSSVTGVTILSTLNQHDSGHKKIKVNHSRHPLGTKASGLGHGKDAKVSPDMSETVLVKHKSSVPDFDFCAKLLIIPSAIKRRKNFVDAYCYLLAHAPSTIN